MTSKIILQKKATVGIVISPQDDFELLRICLNSILIQTIKPLVICFFNGKLDYETRNIIYIFSKKYIGPTKIISRKQTLPFGPALNILLNKCSTPFFIRVDPDDFSLPKRFEKIIKNIMLNKSDILYTNYFKYLIDKKKVYKIDLSTRKLPKDLLKINFIAHSTVILKVNSIKKLGGYRNINLAEDYDLWIRSCINNLTFSHLNEYLHIYTSQNHYLGNKFFKYLKTELSLFLTKTELNKNYIFLTYVFLLRSIFYIMPNFIKQIYYILFQNQKSLVRDNAVINKKIAQLKKGPLI